MALTHSAQIVRSGWDPFPQKAQADATNMFVLTYQASNLLFLRSEVTLSHA
jgi:hypothetical protein